MSTPTVHILVIGAPLCNFTTVEPRDWPEGHQWVRQEERKEATCKACLIAYEQLNHRTLK